MVSLVRPTKIVFCVLIVLMLAQLSCRIGQPTKGSTPGASPEAEALPSPTVLIEPAELPTPTLANTPAAEAEPTENPEADLAFVLLRQSEVPQELTQVSIYKGMTEMKDRFSSPEVLESLVDGYVVSYANEKGERSLTQGLLNYDGEQAASQALAAMYEATYRVKEEIPPIGDECWAITNETLSPFDLSITYTAKIAWRSGQTLLYVSARGDAEISLEEMTRLAKVVQKHFEEGAP